MLLEREKLEYATWTYLLGDLLVFFERLGQLSLRRVQLGSDGEPSSGSDTEDRTADLWGGSICKGQFSTPQKVRGRTLTSLPSVKLLPNMRQEIRGLASGRVRIRDEMRREIREPLVFQQLLGSGALLRVDCEARADEIARGLGDVCPVLVRLKLEVTARDCARLLLGRIAVEGRVPTQEEVGDYTHRPDVDGFPVPGCRCWSGAQCGEGEVG
jgi:hypothetical protein